MVANRLNTLQGGGNDFNTFSTLNQRFQQPLLDPLISQAMSGLRGGVPQFPGFAGQQPVFDPAQTQQFFQSAFVDPTLRGLTGVGGVIPRIGARAAQRGTFFSSGRQQQEAQAVSGAFGNLAGKFNELTNQDLGATYNEFIRTQPQQVAQQALNFLGTPMTVTQERQPNPWASLIGGGLGMGAGALLAAPTGGLSMGSGAFLGGQAGAGIGNLFG